MSVARQDNLDPLSDFFERVRLRGRLFYAGTVRGILDLEKPSGMAFVHIVENGGLDLIRPGHAAIQVRQPSLLLCPSSCRYKLQATSAEGARIVCASFDLGESQEPSFPLGVPDAIVFSKDSVPNASPLVDLLLAEFRGEEAGRHKSLGVLFEYMLVLLVREAIQRRSITKGVLAAILDARIGAALSEIHRYPDLSWSVEQLARVAGMSRSAFASRFHQVLGQSPIAYLTGWRVKLAQDLIRQGTELKIVAAALGYSSQAAFTRAFGRELGLSPAGWRKVHASASTVALPV